jgi:flagellar assembly protein FliH
MSSSPRPSANTTVEERRTAVPDFQPFPYDSVPATAVPHRIINEVLTNSARSGEMSRAMNDTAARETQARTQGRQEGQAAAQKIFEEQLAQQRAGITDALAQFTRDRAAYFAKIEGEVVQLALSIARKIMHREAQVDSLLLAGIVRVALEKIDGATGVVLRVHPQNAADWRRYLTTHLDPANLPEIVEDASQPADRCTLKTSMGTAVVGLEVQFKEIEQGLMDLLAARPGAAS